MFCPHDLLRPYYEPLLWFMIIMYSYFCTIIRVMLYLLLLLLLLPYKNPVWDKYDTIQVDAKYNYFMSECQDRLGLRWERNCCASMLELKWKNRELNSSKTQV